MIRKGYFGFFKDMNEGLLSGWLESIFVTGNKSFKRNSCSLTLGYRVWYTVLTSLCDYVLFRFFPLVCVYIPQFSPFRVFRSFTVLFLPSLCATLSHLAFCKGNKIHIWQVSYLCRSDELRAASWPWHVLQRSRPGFESPAGEFGRKEGCVITVGMTETSTSLAWDPSAELSYTVGVYQHETSESYLHGGQGEPGGSMNEWMNVVLKLISWSLYHRQLKIHKIYDCQTVIGTRPKIKLGKRIVMRNTAFYSIRKREKTFANHTFDKEIISNIYKELMQRNSEKPSNPV